MTALVTGLVFGAVIVIAAPGVDVVSAQEASTTLTPAALTEMHSWKPKSIGSRHSHSSGWQHRRIIRSSKSSCSAS
jgi:hypothetical protein